MRHIKVLAKKIYFGVIQIHVKYISNICQIFFRKYPHNRILQKDVKNICNISLQLKYCRKIFVKYCKIFDRNIKI